MALIIKPGETIARKKRVHFAIYDINGLITDHEASLLSLGWAVDTFAPAAGDLKVGYDNIGPGSGGTVSSNYAGTFAYRKNGEWYYEFADAEVAAGLLGGGADADTVYIEFYRTGYRSFIIRIPLRYDVESIKDSTITAASIAADAITAAKIATDAIDADALKADAVTEIQSGLATAAAVAAVQADTDDIQTRLPAALVGGRIDASVGAMANNVVTAAAIAADAIGASELAADAVAEIQTGLATAAAVAAVQADTDDIQTRLPAALVGGRIDASVGAMAANVVTAAAIATDAIDADSIKADAVTEIQSGLATAADLATAQAAITDVQTDVDELQTTAASIDAKTSALPSDPADASDVAAAIATLTAKLDIINGLHQRNSVLDGGAAAIGGLTGWPGVQYSATKELRAARRRVFANKADADAATLGAADDAEGEIARYVFTGTGTGTGLTASFRFTADLEP
jgi:hypothetical protein